MTGGGCAVIGGISPRALKVSVNKVTSAHRGLRALCGELNLGATSGKAGTPGERGAVRSAGASSGRQPG